MNVQPLLVKVMVERLIDGERARVAIFPST